jgi:hypothetical protein
VEIYEVFRRKGHQEGGAGGTSEASLPPGFPPLSESEEPFRAIRLKKE